MNAMPHAQIRASLPEPVPAVDLVDELLVSLAGPVPAAPDEPLRSKHTPIWEGGPEFPGDGRQLLFRFPNGYGASLVVGGVVTYGDAEIAVLKWDGDDYDIVYDTPVTSDVRGHLTVAEAEAVLDAIAALPSPAREVEAPIVRLRGGQAIVPAENPSVMHDRLGASLDAIVAEQDAEASA